MPARGQTLFLIISFLIPALAGYAGDVSVNNLRTAYQPGSLFMGHAPSQAINSEESFSASAQFSGGLALYDEFQDQGNTAIQNSLALLPEISFLYSDAFRDGLYLGFYAGTPTDTDLYQKLEISGNYELDSSSSLNLNIDQTSETYSYATAASLSMRIDEKTALGMKLFFAQGIAQENADISFSAVFSPVVDLLVNSKDTQKSTTNYIRTSFDATFSEKNSSLTLMAAPHIYSMKKTDYTFNEAFFVNDVETAVYTGKNSTSVNSFIAPQFSAGLTQLFFSRYTLLLQMDVFPRYVADSEVYQAELNDAQTAYNAIHYKGTKENLISMSPGIGLNVFLPRDFSLGASWRNRTATTEEYYFSGDESFSKDETVTTNIFSGTAGWSTKNSFLYGEVRYTLSHIENVETSKKGTSSTAEEGKNQIDIGFFYFTLGYTYRLVNTTTP